MLSFYTEGRRTNRKGYIRGGVGTETSFLYKGSAEGEGRTVIRGGLVLKDEILKSDTGKYIFNKESVSFLEEL